MNISNHTIFSFIILMIIININVAALAQTRNCNQKGKVTGLFIQGKHLYVRLETTTKFIASSFNLDSKIGNFMAKVLLDSFLFYKTIELNCSSNDKNIPNFKNVTTIN